MVVVEIRKGVSHMPAIANSDVELEFAETETISLGAIDKIKKELALEDTREMAQKLITHWVQTKQLTKEQYNYLYEEDS